MNTAYAKEILYLLVSHKLVFFKSLCLQGMGVKECDIGITEEQAMDRAHCQNEEHRSVSNFCFGVWYNQAQE